MDILETLVRFKDDIFQWCTNNFNQKVSNTQMINGYFLENDIELTTDDIEGFDGIKEDINTLIKQLNGYKIVIVNDLPTVVDDNTIYFLREKYIYILCKDNIFFDVIAKINKSTSYNLITKKIIVATDSYKVSLTKITTKRLGKTKSYFELLDGKYKLEFAKSNKINVNNYIIAKTIAKLMHPYSRNSKIQDKSMNFMYMALLTATIAIPKLGLLHEILYDNILRKLTAKNIILNNISNELCCKLTLVPPASIKYAHINVADEISGKATLIPPILIKSQEAYSIDELDNRINIAHPIVKPPEINLLHTVYNKINIHSSIVKPHKINVLHKLFNNHILNNGKSHKNNISYPLSLLINEVHIPQNIPVSHKINIFTTLLSYITVGLDSKMSTIHGFKKEYADQQIVSNKVISADNVTLDITTWKHPVRIEIEENNNNDLHVYQVYKANCKNNTLTIQ